MAFISKGTRAEKLDGASLNEPSVVYEYKSDKLNLKYNKLIPFLGIYLIYKFIL